VRSLATYTLTAGIVAVAGFLAGGALFMPDDAPLHDWAGLYQRALVLAVLFPCRILLSLRLLQVATSRTQSIDTASGAPRAAQLSRRIASADRDQPVLPGLIDQPGRVRLQTLALCGGVVRRVGLLE